MRDFDRFVEMMNMELSSREDFVRYELEKMGCNPDRKGFEPLVEIIVKHKDPFGWDMQDDFIEIAKREGVNLTNIKTNVANIVHQAMGKGYEVGKFMYEVINEATRVDALMKGHNIKWED